MSAAAASSASAALAIRSHAAAVYAAIASAYTIDTVWTGASKRNAARTNTHAIRAIIARAAEACAENSDTSTTDAVAASASPVSYGRETSGCR
jgi:ribose 1,5-bisphosphokinase PhnN